MCVHCKSRSIRERESPTGSMSAPFPHTDKWGRKLVADGGMRRARGDQVLCFPCLLLQLCKELQASSQCADQADVQGTSARQKQRWRVRRRKTDRQRGERERREECRSKQVCGNESSISQWTERVTQQLVRAGGRGLGGGWHRGVRGSLRVVGESENNEVENRDLCVCVYVCVCVWQSE